METNYFGMDSFDRDVVYCANSVSNMKSKGIEMSPQTTKYLDLKGLQTYHDLS